MGNLIRPGGIDPGPRLHVSGTGGNAPAAQLVPVMNATVTTPAHGAATRPPAASPGPAAPLAGAAPRHAPEPPPRAAPEPASTAPVARATPAAPDAPASLAAPVQAAPALPPPAGGETPTDAAYRWIVAVTHPVDRAGLSAVAKGKLRLGLLAVGAVVLTVLILLGLSDYGTSGYGGGAGRFRY